MAVRTITVRVTGDVANFHNAMRGVDAQIVRTEQRAAATTKVFHQMRGGMASLAQAAVGQAVPGLTSLSGVLGSFAIGSVATTGVLLGISAIAGAFRLLTKDARETQKTLEDLEKQAFRLSPLARLEDEELRARAELAKAQERLQTAQGGIRVLGRTFVNPREVEAARREVERVQRILDALAIQIGELSKETGKPFRAIETSAKAAAVAVRELNAGIVRIVNPFLAQGARDAAISAQQGLRNVGLINRPPSREGAMRAAEQAIRDMERAEAAAQSMAQSVATAFESWVTGAQKAKDAIRDMVNSILRDLLRLVAQRAIVEPLAGAFLGAIGGNSTAGGSRAVVVNQSVNFAISAVDAPGVASLLQQQSGTIAQIVGDAARRSTGFRAQLMHG